MASPVSARPFAIVIHGGAGTILKKNMTPEREAAYIAALTEAVEAGHKVLAAGGTSLEAVQAAIIPMEDSPLFNAGHGAVLTHEGHVEMDASIMEGSEREAGAIAGVRSIRNPVTLAAAVMEKSPHVMLMGEGAEQFAKQEGFELVDNDYFKTKRRQDQLERVKSRNVTVLSEDETDKKFGTVGAVALDQDGNIAAATSTGGMTNKRFGRVGDSPVIGAGTYADNAACGISATGHGEYFIRAAVAHAICARVKLTGASLQEAADAVVMDELMEMGGDGGIIGIDPDGQVVFSFNSAGMYRAAIGVDGRLRVGIYKEEVATP